MTRTYVTKKGSLYPVVGKSSDSKEVIRHLDDFYVIAGFADMNKVELRTRGNDGFWFDVATKAPLILGGELEARLERDPKEGLRIVGYHCNESGEVLPYRGDGNDQIITSKIREVRD